jgi:hypothetical protein
MMQKNNMLLVILLALSSAAVAQEIDYYDELPIELLAAKRWQGKLHYRPDAEPPYVSWEVPAGQKIIQCRRFGEELAALGDWDEICFDYQISENAAWFGIKVTDYPLFDGADGTWQIAIAPGAAEAWQPAQLKIHQPRWIWDDRPSQTRRTFDVRIISSDEAPTKAKIANLRLRRAKVAAAVSRCEWSEDGRTVDLHIQLRNRSAEAQHARVSVSTAQTEQLLTPVTSEELRLSEQGDLKLVLRCQLRDIPPPLRPVFFQIKVHAGSESAKGLAAVQDYSGARPLQDIPAPSLLFTAAQLPEIRRRIREDSHAQQWWARQAAAAERMLSQDFSYPPRGGQWWHWYSCKECGTRLKTSTPTLHVCPSCQAEYSGWPYDDVPFSRAHDGIACAIRDLGIAYQLAEDGRYADKAKELLLGYAERYLSYELHNIHGKPQRGGGRVHPQALDESIWLVMLTQGYDAIKERLSAQEQELLAKQLLLPAAEMIRENNHGIHNHECWHLSAYGLVGITLGRSELISAAMYGPVGFLQQLEQGVCEEGAWFEGAWGYHFYTLNALQPMAVAARNLGLEIPSDKYRRMYDIPLAFLTPSWHLPAFNDSGRMLLTPARNGADFELAAANWGSAQHRWWCSQSPRQNMAAVLWGEREPAGAAPAFTSGAYPHSGAVILRSQTPALPPGDIPSNYLAMDIGAHGGWHGHYDKLNIVLWGHGQMLAEDPGCISYGNPAHHEWYKQTLSHNTLVVDGKSQAEAEGELFAFSSSDGMTICSAGAGAIYPGVQAGRALALSGDVLLDALWAHSDEEHLYEWVFHSRGRFSSAFAGEAAEAPTGDGYKWVPDWRRASHDGHWQAAWTCGNVQLELHQFAAAGELWNGTGMAQPPPEKFHLVSNRVKARKVLFATIMTLTPVGQERPAVALRQAEILADGRIMMQAVVADKSYSLCTETRAR